MYEKYSKQALPNKYYRELLGSALCAFNTNNAFIIENILKITEDYSWYELIDKESGYLKSYIKCTISKNGNDEILNIFDELVSMRNRIIHSFQITDKDNNQKLATKTKVKDGNKQFIITEEYLHEFIAKNEKLSSLLHKFRGF